MTPRLCKACPSPAEHTYCSGCQWKLDTYGYITDELWCGSHRPATTGIERFDAGPYDEQAIPYGRYE